MTVIQNELVDLAATPPALQNELSSLSAKNQTPEAHIFDGGFCEPIATTKLLSTGHVDVARLNSPEAEEMHFFPANLDRLSKRLVIALGISAFLAPGLCIGGSMLYQKWDLNQKIEATRARAEADNKARTDAITARVAADQLAATQRLEAATRAPKVLAGLVEKGLVSTSISSTPASNIFNPDSMQMWASAFWGVDAGKVPDYMEKMTLAGSWAKGVQYLTVMPHTILLTAVVDDNGTRRVWVGVMKDSSGRGTGVPKEMYSVRSIPGVDGSKLYFDPNLGQIEFQQISAGLVAALTN